MRKNYLFLSLIFCGILMMAGCGEEKKNVSQNNPVKEKEKAQMAEETKKIPESQATGPCQEEKVTLPNYGDPGKRLKNCFVEYPGEPSRQDKSYYIVEDICGQFTQDFMENMLGEKIAKVEPPKIATLYNCSYYFNDKDYVTLNLEYLSAENQKKGNEALDRKVAENSQIPMKNMVVYQEDGALNAIYLILGPEKFISLRPSSKGAMDSDKMIGLAVKIGEALKNYK